VVLFTDDYAHADYIAGFNAKQVVSFMIPWLFSTLIDYVHKQLMNSNGQWILLKVG
jgi:hypothetical protein